METLKYVKQFHQDARHLGVSRPQMAFVYAMMVCYLPIIASLVLVINTRALYLKMRGKKS